jgi:hypothetical protein
MKAKIAAGVFVLLALGLLLYTRVAERSAARAPAEANSETVERSAAAKATGGASPAPTPPPPVDFAAVDLDRDVHGVIVRAENGLPVPGAEILAVSYPWRRVVVLNMEGYYEGEPGPETRSASDGTFRLRLRRGQLVGVRVRAQGRSSVEMPDVQAGERVRVELPEAAGVSVAVRDEAGQPVEGADVRFLSRDSLETGGGMTDADGRFDGAELTWEAAPVTVRASHPAHGSGWRTILAGTASVPITLSKGRTITGRVTDAKTRAPLADARVGMNWTLTNAVEVDADGNYALPSWTGKWVEEVAADAPTYAFQWRRVGDADSMDFALQPGGSVVARVVDDAGHALARVYVSAIGSKISGGLQQTSHRHGTTGPDGHVRLDGLNIDLVHRLVLTAPGHARTLVEFQPPPPEEGPLDLGDVTMPPGLAVEGVVLRPDGSPATRTTIILKPRDRAPADFYGNTEERRTDHLGRFRFPDQSPGPCTLEARPQGSPYATRDVVLDGRDLLDVEIRLPGGRELVVIVEDPQGRPIPKAHVSIWRLSGGLTRETDGAGRAAFLVEGAVLQVDCSVPGGGFLQPKAQRDLPETQGEVRFRLQEAGRATGRVVGPDGEPFAGALLAVRRGEDRLGTCVTDRAGEFDAQVPTDGPVDLVFDAVERQLPSGRFYDTNRAHDGALRDVRAGAKGLVLRLQQRSEEGMLRVRVVDPEGKPVGGANFAVVPVQGFGGPATDVEGRALITNLPLEELTLHVNGGLPANLAAPLPLKAVPRGQEIVFRCRPGRVLSGVVVLPDGTPLVGSVIVTAHEGALMVDYAQSGEGGRFELHVPQEPVGTIRLSCHASASDGRLLSAEAQPQPGEREVRLQLDAR